jgi:hypothetical protein
MPRRNRRDRRPIDPLDAAGSPRTHAPSWAGLVGYEVHEVAGGKEYRCPGCDHAVRPGLRHLVVVPDGASEERRHWHSECWRRELRRIGAYRAPDFE